MDRNRFDALARLLGATGSRRGALGALLGGALLGTGFDAVAKNKKNNRNKKKNKTTCFGTESCPFPGDGQDFEACNLAGSELESCDGCSFRRADLAEAGFDGGSYQGASFREANLRGADLSGADVSGASFRDACLIDADFTGANTDGAHFGGATFCNTTLADGSLDDSGCDQANACCGSAGCVKDTDCGGTQPYCCDNVCSEFCCLDSQCPGEESCDQGVCQIPNVTCAADPNACEGTFTPCGGTGGAGTCFCYVTTEGDSRCLNLNAENTLNCLALPQCTSSNECNDGEFCADLVFAGVCCLGKICGRECPEFGERARGGASEVSPPRP